MESAIDEAIAQYLTAPKSFREFKSFTALAEYRNIYRMTVYRHSKDTKVLEWARFLSAEHKMPGDLIARVNWPVSSLVKPKLPQQATRTQLNCARSTRGPRMTFSRASAYDDKMRGVLCDHNSTRNIRRKSHVLGNRALSLAIHRSRGP